MRLINVTSQTVEEFESTTAPPYVILSHTWTDHEEIRLQDLSTNRTSDKEAGYEKLDNGCRLASEHGYSYIWLDTCCIDKTNHVELSEAINSMYYWYKNAEVCFAHLADVSAHVNPFEAKSSFFASRWFTRGWTLQELLAPSRVIFVANNSTQFGSKTDLVAPISKITGIPPKYLLGEDLEHASVAMRFSWAADRKTTKPEDIAYCLLGIFDIQMSLLYGERAAGAFRRLQQKIIKTSDDQSIFAWSEDEEQDATQATDMRHSFSLLASSPASFRGSRNIVEAGAPLVPGYLAGIRTPTLINNKGLHLSLPIIPRQRRKVLAILNCSPEGAEGNVRFAICLQDVSTNGGRYVRIERQKLDDLSLLSIADRAVYSSISVRRGEVANVAETAAPQRPRRPPPSAFITRGFGVVTEGRNISSLGKDLAWIHQASELGSHTAYDEDSDAFTPPVPAMTLSDASNDPVRTQHGYASRFLDYYLRPDVNHPVVEGGFTTWRETQFDRPLSDLGRKHSSAREL